MGIELNTEQVMTVYKCENWFRSSDSKQVFEIAGAAGTGKAQPIYTILPTPNGPRQLGDLKIGDYVFSDTGEPVKVIGIYDQGKLDTYRVTFEDGRSTLCNDEHIWNVIYKDSNINMTLREIINLRKANNYKDFYVPGTLPVKYKHKEFIMNSPNEVTSDCIDPDILAEYEYGDVYQRIDFIRGIFHSTLFGSMSFRIEDSTLYRIVFTNRNEETMSVIRDILRSLGHKVYFYRSQNDYCIFFDVSKEILDMYTSNSCNEIEKKFSMTYREPCRIANIQKLDIPIEMRCIYVDNESHLYLTTDYIVTHNTTIVLYLIEQLGLKMNQVLFLAYQGKAACRMMMTGLPAQTIHSAIYRWEKDVVYDDNGYILRNEYGKAIRKGRFVLRDYIGGDKNIKLIVVDEAGMVNQEIAEDLQSFGIPIIVLGDLNQLPPVFGNPYYLQKPDVVLRKVMRQNEGNPIIALSQMVLAGKTLNAGVYGSSAIITKNEMKEADSTLFSKADIVITDTNKLRHHINNYFREYLRSYKHLDYPHVGEKVICRKNNWKMSVDDGIYLTNGMSGYVDAIDRYNFKSSKQTMIMDFRPDFTQSVFRDVEFSYNHMFNPPLKTFNNDSDESTVQDYSDMYYNKFEFGYAITSFLSQGNQFNRVVYLNENQHMPKEDKQKHMYTAITRAIDSIVIVI